MGLTPPPCLRRVRRLEAEGVIAGYRAVTDPRAAGRAFEVIVAVAEAEAFAAFRMNELTGLPAVARAVSHQTMGRLKG